MPEAGACVCLVMVNTGGIATPEDGVVGVDTGDTILAVDDWTGVPESVCSAFFPRTTPVGSYTHPERTRDMKISTMAQKPKILIFLVLIVVS